MLFLASGETQALDISKFDRWHGSALAPVAKNDGAVFEGLQYNQTFICVSHVKEEVPSFLEKWMCLPEAGTGRPARFGEFKKPLNEDPRQWEEIWAM